jgi:two-component system sensor histidine kinase KdpD
LHKQLADRTVKVKLPEGIPMILVDAVMIEQVLINLLENASRYTPPGSELEIVADIRESEVEIAVADHGPGIPKGLEERLFEKFYQTRHETAQSGVGLGLAICRAIVEVHGGSIFARNRAEGGAVFVITLPLDQTPPSVEPEE